MGKKILEFLWKEKFIIFLLGFWVYFKYFAPFDPTDKPAEYKRSGLMWYKDHGTGCEYLAGPGLFGTDTLIKRVDKNGKHICN